MDRALVDNDGVGAHVSGGVDSTAVACLAHRRLRTAGRDGLPAGFSWSPDESSVARLEGDERRLLDDIVVTEGFPVRLIGAQDDVAGFGDLDPDRYPRTITTREVHVMPRAAADGVQVMLSGFGGDEAASFRRNRVRAGLVARGRFDLVARQGWSTAWIAGVALPGRSVASGRALLGGLLDAVGPAGSAIVSPRNALARRAHDSRADALLRDPFPAAADARRERLERITGARDHRDVMIVKLTEGYLQQRITSCTTAGSCSACDTATRCSTSTWSPRLSRCPGMRSPPGAGVGRRSGW